jgi:hypothetical protein
MSESDTLDTMEERDDNEQSVRNRNETMDDTNETNLEPSTFTRRSTQNRASKRKQLSQSHPVPFKAPKNKASVPLNWRCNAIDISSKVPNYQTDENDPAKNELKERVKSPVVAFRYFFSQQMLGQIVQETNRYAGATQKRVHNLNATNEEILTFIGVMLLSGYHTLPY